MEIEHKSGELVGARYKLEELLGEGGYGAVWRAVDLTSQRSIAIKFLHSEFADDTAQRRFEREAAALSKLQHPGCVAMFDFGRDEGGEAFLVTELVEGAPINVWAAHKPVDEIVAVIVQILEALEHAHARGIVHRDLKPPNILVSQTGHAKVLDFGIASVTGAQRGDITETGEFVGTPGYMSPEQLLGSKEVGPAADVYSVGVILWELLAGARIFEGRTTMAICMRHLREPAPQLTGDYPVELKRLLGSMLAKSADDRPRSVDAIVHTLQRIAGPRSNIVAIMTPAELEPAPVATQPSPVAAAPAKVSTQGYLWLAAVLGVLVVVAAVAVYALASDREPPPVRRVVIPAAEVAAPTIPESTPIETDVVDAGDVDPCEVIPDVAGVRFSSGPLKWFVHLPRDYEAGRRYPVMMLFHKMGGDAGRMIAESDLGRRGLREDWVIVSFDGPRRRLKEAPIVELGDWLNVEPDDVQTAMREVALDVCVDQQRVFAVGHGAGGDVVRDVACAYPLAGMAFVGSGEVVGAGRCDTPTPQLRFAGRKDPFSPFDGGNACFGEQEWKSSAQIEADWRKRNACGADKRELMRAGTDVCWTWDCEHPFVSCHVNGGGNWPGSKPEPVVHRGCESTTPRFPMARRILDFFNKQKPSAKPFLSP